MTDSSTVAGDYGVAPRGFRLPPATHVGRVRIQVADLDRSISYYETVIGFRVIERDAGVARLGPHGDDTILLELHERPGARSVERRGRIGLYHFAILLPSRPALGRFLRHLTEIGERAGMSDHFVSEALYLSDPDGIGIEVYADRPRTAWRHEARQLTMTTIPLDVDDLIAAGGTEAWTGAPAGTVIGHIHLYVRDIDQAASFYHDALGFDKVVWDYPGALFLSAGGYHHHLGTNTWAASAPIAAADDARLIEWEVVVPTTRDVSEAAASLERAGFNVDRAGTTAAVRDPWGTQLRLVSEAR
jgi:catechol 2,3-dioxygenase